MTIRKPPALSSASEHVWIAYLTASDCQITAVDNLSTYGINLEQLAEQLQTNLGARAWLEGAGSVLVQGLWDRSVADHMSSVYGLPSSCIDNKAAGKTGMSQRKEKKATNIRTK